MAERYEVQFKKDQEMVHLNYEGKSLAFAMAKRMQRRARESVVTRYVAVSPREHDPKKDIQKDRRWWRPAEKWKFVPQVVA